MKERGCACVYRVQSVESAFKFLLFLEKGGGGGQLPPASDVHFMSVFLGREALEDHSQLPKKANKCSVEAVCKLLYVWLHRHVCVIPT